MKKKSNGKVHGRLNHRGFDQIEGRHFYQSEIAAPVTDNATFKITWILLTKVPGWIATVIDAEGTFLQCKFTSGKIIYAVMPDDMEKFYGRNKSVVL